VSDACLLRLDGRRSVSSCDGVLMPSSWLSCADVELQLEAGRMLVATGCAGFRVGGHWAEVVALIGTFASASWRRGACRWKWQWRPGYDCRDSSLSAPATVCVRQVGDVVLGGGSGRPALRKLSVFFWLARLVRQVETCGLACRAKAGCWASDDGSRGRKVAEVALCCDSLVGRLVRVCVGMESARRWKQWLDAVAEADRAP
jgi:hypothetical protein